MFPKGLHYEPSNLQVKLSNYAVSSIRKDLLNSLKIPQAVSSYNSEVQITINTPLMSYRGRHLGVVHRPKHSYCNAEFKKIYNTDSRSAHMIPIIEDFQLNRVSISRKKFNQFDLSGSVNGLDKKLTKNDIIESKSINTEVSLKRVENQDKSNQKGMKMKKAANYLIKLGRALKSLVKPEQEAKGPLRKSLSTNTGKSRYRGKPVTKNKDTKKKLHEIRKCKNSQLYTKLKAEDEVTNKRKYYNEEIARVKTLRKKTHLENSEGHSKINLIQRKIKVLL